MTKKGDQHNSQKGGRFFSAVEISASDLEQASAIEGSACPRRYCWWWRSLSFEWDIKVLEGCTWPEAEKREHWKFKNIPCCRCVEQSDIDHFEPREPHIEADGIDWSAWKTFRDANREKHAQ